MPQEKKRKRHHSRSRSREHEFLLEKLQKLEEAVDKLVRNQSRSRSRTPRSGFSNHSEPTGGKDGGQSQGPPGPQITSTDKRHSETTSQNVLQQDTESDGSDYGETQAESPILEIHNNESLSEDVLEILGADPARPKENTLKLSSQVVIRWTHTQAHGLLKEQRSELLDKYELPQEYEPLKTPVLNDEIASILSPDVVKQDSGQAASQEQLLSGILAQGQIMQFLIENVDAGTAPIRNTVLKSLWDSSQLLTDLFYRLSMARRQRINPYLSKTAKDLLSKTAPEGGYLYGRNFGEQVKKALSLQKMGKDIKAPPVVKFNPNTPRTGQKSNFYSGTAHRVYTSTSGQQQQDKKYFTRDRQYSKTTPLNRYRPVRHSQEGAKSRGQTSRSTSQTRRK